MRLKMCYLCDTEFEVERTHAACLQLVKCKTCKRVFQMYREKKKSRESKDRDKKKADSILGEMII